MSKEMDFINIARECNKAFETGLLDETPYPPELRYDDTIFKKAYLVGLKYREKYGFPQSLPYVSNCFYYGMICDNKNRYIEELAYKIGVRFREKYLI